MTQILCFWLIKYKEGYAGIINSGVINVGSRNLYGPGVYATRFNSRFVAFLNGVPLKNSTHKIVINNMGEFVRRGLIPGTFRTKGVPYKIP